MKYLKRIVHIFLLMTCSLCIGTGQTAMAQGLDEPAQERVLFVQNTVLTGEALPNDPYDRSYSQEQIDQLEKVADKILSKINPEMSQEQILLYLHDYLVTHCVYGFSSDPFGIYGALVEQSAVCAGYAKAFKYLSNRAGIPCYCVSSQHENHAWNMVFLNGKYYFVDCTFDDPFTSNKCEASYCHHLNFLNSNATFREGHSGTDWIMGTTGHESVNVSNYCMDSTEYDEYYWKNINIAIPVVGQINAIVSETIPRQILLRNINGEMKKVDLPLSTLDSIYYRYVTLTARGDFFYVATDEAIYKLSKTGKLQLLYELTDEEKKEKKICGIQADDYGLNIYLIEMKYVRAGRGAIFEERRIALDAGDDLDFEGDENTPEGSVCMFRVYNPNSGEHFYTGNTDEVKMLYKAGWNFEGKAWYAPETSDTPVYRLYNPNAGDHHYTTSVGERDFLVSVGWNDEGIGWYSAADSEEPLYRLYNPNALQAGSHHYTTNPAERDMLVSVGWNDEGIGWYGSK